MSAQPAYHDDRIEHLRVPPHSIEAEQSVIGGLLLAGERAWDSVADVLDRSDFYRRDHQLIFGAIHALATATPRKPVDTTTVEDWIRSQGLVDQIGNGAYLVELACNTPSAANIRAYAQIVRDKARMRKLIEVGTGIVNAGFKPDGRDADELIGFAQTQVGALLADEPCELESVAPVMARVWERLEARSRAEPGAMGLSTGLKELDSIIGGLRPGCLYILAARPKCGKTTLAVNVAEHVALRESRPVAVFSFEMQPEELGDRMLASTGNIDGAHIRSGELDDIDWVNASEAIRKLRAAEIFVSKPRVARVEHVVAQARRRHAIKPLGLVIIDYLQLMQTMGDNRAQALGDVTRMLKLTAEELGVPVLLLSQLSRDLEKRPDKRPIPSDLRDSGAIEQDADAVIFIYRDEIYDRASRYKGTAEIIVALQRNGPPGDFRALYLPERFKFSDLPEYWQPAPIPESEKAEKSRGFRKSKKAVPARDVTGDEA